MSDLFKKGRKGLIAIVKELREHLEAANKDWAQLLALYKKLKDDYDKLKEERK